MASGRAGGRHVLSWRAAGAAGVTALALAGGGLVVAAVTAEPPRPPQPAAEAGGEFPAGDGTGTGFNSDASPPEPTGTGGPATASPGSPPEEVPAVDAMATSAATSPPGATRASGQPPADPDQVPPPALGRSVPVRVTIAAIGVRADVMPLNLRPDGTLEVPPLERAELAGWYELGPTPGEVGNSVIVGHVDSAKIGPAVFFKLGALRPGDVVVVTRQDGSVARFGIERVASYPKTQFPSELVYGDADRPQLRLVTCGGTFDKKKRSYEENVIVFATLLP